MYSSKDIDRLIGYLAMPWVLFCCSFGEIHGITQIENDQNACTYKNWKWFTCQFNTFILYTVHSNHSDRVVRLFFFCFMGFTENFPKFIKIILRYFCDRKSCGGAWRWYFLKKLKTDSNSICVGRLLEYAMRTSHAWNSIRLFSLWINYIEMSKMK